MDFEGSFIRGSVEAVKNSTRNCHKVGEKSAQSVAKKLVSGKLKLDTKEDKLRLRAELVNLRDQYAAGAQEGAAAIQNLRHRLVAASEGATSSPADTGDRVRFARYAADFLLRRGLHSSAKILIEKQGLQGLVDDRPFLHSSAAVQALVAQDCGQALAWCSENKLRIRKQGLTVELDLHLRLFWNKILEGKAEDAIKFIQTIPTAVLDVDRHAVGSVLLAMAFAKPELHQSRLPDINIEEFPESIKKFFDERISWPSLHANFRRAVVSVHALSDESPLVQALAVGAASTKSPFCGSHTNSSSQLSECPACDPTLLPFTKGLPFAPATQSHLVCPIQGVDMDGDNPPVLLPSGCLVGTSVVNACMKDGIDVRCPQTGAQFSPIACKKVFIL